MEAREITKAYLDLFIETIKRGGQVVFVEKTNLLAVSHPIEGYLVIEIADKVIDPKSKDEEDGQDSNSS